MSQAAYDVVILAGGRSRRMQGQDKTREVVGEHPLLDRVISAAGGAQSVVVVGDERVTSASVTWCREQPRGGGPAAALAEGLRHVNAPVTVVLAADLPFVTRHLVDELATRAADRGVVAVDATGREQWLLSAWPTRMLRGVDLRAGASLKTALGHLDRASLPGVDERALLDCDTPDDLAQARRLAT
jgi:molybdopterin-guanine dinucleotide biosynthesis protein A